MKYAPDKEVLYEIIGILSKADLPIIFKGANVTNILLQQSNSPYTRMTTDIDSSWHGKNPTTDNIKELLRQALQPYGYDVSKVRNMEGSKVSAGFRILKDGIPITKMDIDIHKVNHSEKYLFGTVEFTGVSVEEILSDKICAISNEHIFRRTKDLLDIFSLTQALNVSPLQVYETIKKSDNKLGNFAEFVINKDLLGEAYSHLKVTNKPDFEEVYNNVSKYIKEMNKVITKESNKDSFEDDDVTVEFENMILYITRNEQNQSKVGYYINDRETGWMIDCGSWFDDCNFTADLKEAVKSIIKDKNITEQILSVNEGDRFEEITGTLPVRQRGGQSM